MPTSVVPILDPEVLIPSEEGHHLAFWLRLSEFAEDRSLRIGPATMESWSAFVSSATPVEGLPQGEMYALFGKLASRGYQATARRPVCHHLLGCYSPFWGAANNGETLSRDLQMVSSAGVVAIATVDDVWGSWPVPGCSDCLASQAVVLPGPPFQFEKAWRAEVLRKHSSDPGALADHASNLFPRLTFASDAWSGLASLRGGADELFEGLLQHLSVLNDDVATIWRDEASTTMRQRRLGSLGIAASPENGATHRNSAAMAARTIVFGDRGIVCEWHTKLRPEINRVYFAVEGDTIFVGAIVDHL